MIDLAVQIWTALFGAALIGCLVGALASGAKPSSLRADKLLGALLVAFCGALIVASAQGSIGGAAGAWLDIGALILPAYLAGCCLGCVVRRLAPSPART